jgi:hypothetical protein
VKYGYSLPIPLTSVRLIPGLSMVPMNIMAQNTINELGWIVLKDRLTHDQSWKWSLGTLVNSRVQKRAPSNLQIRFLHSEADQLGISSKETVSGSENSRYKN